MNHVNDSLNARRNDELRKEQHDLDARRAARGMGLTAAAGMQTPLPVEFREQHGDPTACFKMLKSMQPHGLEKSEPVVVETKPEPTRKLSQTESVTGPVSVTDLIRKAQSNPGAIEDLQRGYSGREIAAIAKAAAAKPREVGNSAFDKVSLPLRKALASFDSIVRDAVERAMA